MRYPPTGMSPVSVFLLAIATIFVVGIVGEIVFSKTGVPDVVWLIGVGVIIGPVSGLVSHEGLMEIAPYFGALTLVIVLFDGGSELRLGDLKKAAGRGTFMAVFGFILAVIAVAGVTKAACWAGILPSSWTWMHAIMVGTILGGSSSVVIMPALSKAGLSPKISNLVNLESALTDVLSVVATGAVIQILASTSADAGGAGAAAATLGKSFGIGVGVGAVAGLLTVLVLNRLETSEYAYPLLLGFFLVVYVIVDEMGGSAALAILTAAVMAGNAPALSKSIGLAQAAHLGRNVKGVHGVITFIIKSFFFCFIGAMLGPPWSLLFFGVGIGLILLLARVPNVLLATARSGLSTPARSLVGVLMPRGMAAGVLAMMPYQAGIEGTESLPVVIFSAVLTTILIFAVGFPILKKRLPPSDLADGGGNANGTLAGSFQSADVAPALARALEGRPEISGDAATIAAPAVAREAAKGSMRIPIGPADATSVDPGGPGARSAVPLSPIDDSEETK
ncbi:MAG: cell volume regulation protein A [Polyangiales bacterium]|jgi:cell volume regulation protein A